METPETEGCLSKEQGIIFDHMESDNNNNYKSKGKYLLGSDLSVQGLLLKTLDTFRHVLTILDTFVD